MNQFIEKRQYIRVPLTFVTVEVYSAFKQIDSSETCSIIDMSENGMKILSKENYEIQQRLRVTFILPGSTIPIRANAFVVYQQPHSTLRYTGIQFTDLGLIEFTLLKKYIETLSKKN